MPPTAISFLGQKTTFRLASLGGLKISQEKERSVGVTLMLSGCGAPILCLPLAAPPHTCARTRCVGEPQTKGVKWGPRLVPPAWEAFAPSGPF